jgi:hypothetical protein
VSQGYRAPTVPNGYIVFVLYHFHPHLHLLVSETAFFFLSRTKSAGGCWLLLLHCCAHLCVIFLKGKVYLDFLFGFTVTKIRATKTHRKQKLIKKDQQLADGSVEDDVRIHRDENA